MLRFLSHKGEVALRKLAQWRSQRLSERNTDLWTALQDHQKQTHATRCSDIDFACPHRELRRCKAQDGTPSFDFDLLQVLQSPRKPVAALTDKRVSTCFVLQQIVGSDKLRYSLVEGLGYLEPCTRSDLGALDAALSSTNFARSFKPFGRTLLRMARP